jgi:hypothetical protein
MDQAENSALELLDAAAQFSQETLSKVDALQQLAEDVNELLSESEASCRHSRLKAEYAQAKASHATLIKGQLSLLGQRDDILGAFRRTHYEGRVKEFIEANGKLRTANSKAQEELGKLVPVLEPVRDRVMAVPGQMALAVGAALVSPSCIARWHFETLSAYLDRPSTWQRLIEGLREVLKAVLLDASGAVVPFLGTAEVLCELSVSQMSRDRERIRSANNDISRLYFFIDHLDSLSRGVEAAQDNAKRGKEFTEQANRRFDDESTWLIETVNSI